MSADTDCRACGAAAPAAYGSCTAFRCPTCNHWNVLKRRGPRESKPAKIKRWFSGKYCVSVRLKWFNAWDVAHGHGKYFDSFEEAKADQIKMREVDVALMDKRLKSAERALQKARGMKDPLAQPAAHETEGRKAPGVDS